MDTLETIYQDELRTVTYSQQEYAITPAGRPAKRLAVSGGFQPITSAPRQVRDAVAAAGLTGYVWAWGLAMPRPVAEAIVAHRDARKREWAAAHPGAAERKEIADLFSRADHAEHNPGYQDYPLACALRAEARGRLHTWSKRYPAEWTEERAADLRAAAEHQRDLAVGATVWDCDGSLSREDQESRAAAFNAEATRLENAARECVETTRRGHK